VLRSVFTYQHHVDEFLAWCRAVGSERLRNSPDLVTFSADKLYLSELSAPTIPTAFVAPGDPLPELRGEIVVKPNVSSGARDTGRFTPATHDDAVSLIEQINARGRVALVQPYMSSVDGAGETALVFFGGELSHVLRKRAVLRPDEIAPIAREGFARQLGVAQAMLEEDLVAPAEASPAELALAEGVVAEVAERFGTPLFLRVDLVRDGRDAPVLIEIEAIDPLLYLGSSPGAAERFVAAVRAS
jgi:glutathione synthase/RimK-type ligase-like ATP-grasp enzyme